jgi:hypothetical protein
MVGTAALDPDAGGHDTTESLLWRAVSMVPEDLAGWVAVNPLQRLGPLQVRRALREFGSPSEVAFRVPPAQLAGALGLSDGGAETITERRRGLRRRAEEEIRSAERLEIRRQNHRGHGSGI